MKSAYVKINAEAIRRHCVANGYTMADLARRMGRTQSYFSNCLSRGSISASAYPLLVSVAGVNPDAFLARETPPKTEVSPAPPSPAGGTVSLCRQSRIASVSPFAMAARRSPTRGASCAGRPSWIWHRRSLTPPT